MAYRVFILVIGGTDSESGTSFSARQTCISPGSIPQLCLQLPSHLTFLFMGKVDMRITRKSRPFKCGLEIRLASFCILQCFAIFWGVHSFWLWLIVTVTALKAVFCICFKDGNTQVLLDTQPTWLSSRNVMELLVLIEEWVVPCLWPKFFLLIKFRYKPWGCYVDHSPQFTFSHRSPGRDGHVHGVASLPVVYGGWGTLTTFTAALISFTVASVALGPLFILLPSSYGKLVAFLSPITLKGNSVACTFVTAGISWAGLLESAAGNLVAFLVDVLAVLGYMQKSSLKILASAVWW